MKEREHGFRRWRPSAHSIAPSSFALALLIVLLTPALANAVKPGDLDRSFGKDGRVKADTYASANALRIGGRGRIILAGGSFHMVRYWPSGALDGSFGDDGFASTAFPPPAEGYVSGYARSMAVDSQRRIVLAGSQCYYEDSDHYELTGCEIALTRHNPDGSTDESFGDGGTLEDGCPGSCSASVAIDSQDRIVLASRNGNRSTLTRYDVDGNVDGSSRGWRPGDDALLCRLGGDRLRGPDRRRGRQRRRFRRRTLRERRRSRRLVRQRWHHDDRVRSGWRRHQRWRFARAGESWPPGAATDGLRSCATDRTESRPLVLAQRQADDELWPPASRPRHRDLGGGRLQGTGGRRRRGLAARPLTRGTGDSRTFGKRGKVVSSFRHRVHGGARDAAIDSQDRIYVAGGHTHFLLARYIGYHRR